MPWATRYSFGLLWEAVGASCPFLGRDMFHQPYEYQGVCLTILPVNSFSVQNQWAPFWLCICHGSAPRSTSLASNISSGESLSEDELVKILEQVEEKKKLIVTMKNKPWPMAKKLVELRWVGSQCFHGSQGTRVSFPSAEKGISFLLFTLRTPDRKLDLPSQPFLCTEQMKDIKTQWALRFDNIKQGLEVQGRGKTCA